MGFMSKQMGTWSVVLPFWSENGLWPAVISSSAALTVPKLDEKVKDQLTRKGVRTR